MMAASGKGTTFPTLKINDILQCMSELQVSLAEEELANPAAHKDAVRRVFEQLVELCTGTSREEMNQMPFDATQMLEYASLHEDSIPHLAFLRASQKMMAACGVHDFTVKDFVNPEAKRFRRQLSGVINFAKFREEQLATFTELTMQRQALMSELDRVNVENANLRQRLQLLQDQSAAEAKVITEVEEDVRNIETTINGLNDEQAALRQDYAEAKKRSNNLKDETANLSLALEEKYALKKRLQGQIVQSPDRMRKEMSDATNALETEQNDARQAERHAREIAARLVAAQEAEQDVNAALKALYEVRAEIEKHTTMLHALRDKKTQVAMSNERLQEMVDAQDELARNTQKMEQKLATLRQQGKRRGMELQKALEQLQQDLIEAETDKRTVAQKAEKAAAEAHKLQRQIEMEAAQQQEEIQDMVQAYQRIENAVLPHLHALQDAMLTEASEYCA